MNGKLIVFEGLDCSGKTTQSKLLYEWLVSQYPDKEFYLTREPGGTEVGSKIRELILSPDCQLESKTELFLFLAARSQLVPVIWEKLKRGVTVICDRYIASTIAYQGYGRGITPSAVEFLCDFAIGGMKPDLTVWLKISPEAAIQRMEKRGCLDRIERSSSTNFYHCVADGFNRYFNPNWDLNLLAIDATQDIDTISKEIKAVVNNYLY